MDQLKKMWEDILLSIKEDYGITDFAFKTWLMPLKLKSVDDESNVIYITTPKETDQMGINYITKKFKTAFVMKFNEITGKEYDVVFELDDYDEKPATVQNQPQVMSQNYIDSNLNEKYTFDTFVVGANNRFAQSAALAVAESPGKTYNPLYIYGGPGLGKTHLMHAIGNYIIQNDPKKKILYVTSEDFLNEVIENIRSANNISAMSKFRNKYRSVDVLMIDDIQFIIGRESTQEEFFHTFNALHDAGKQIVLTSDKPPKEMETLESRIRSRFEWGLMADIGAPDYETRMAILRKKVDEEKLNLNDDILNYIANNITTNIREIEGALNKLVAYSNIEKTEITLDIAEKELKNIISPNKKREITPQFIIEVVAEHFNLSVDKMESKNRSATVARPRQIAMYLCKEMTDYPLESIGQFLGGRDHSTIIHGANKVAEEYEKNSELREEVDAIKKKIDPN